jgi:hypothetical protein
MALAALGAKEKNARRLGGTLSVITGIVFFASALAFFFFRQNSLASLLDSSSSIQFLPIPLF